VTTGPAKAAAKEGDEVLIGVLTGVEALVMAVMVMVVGMVAVTIEARFVGGAEKVEAPPTNCEKVPVDPGERDSSREGVGVKRFVAGWATGVVTSSSALLLGSSSGISCVSLKLGRLPPTLSRSLLLLFLWNNRAMVDLSEIFLSGLGFPSLSEPRAVVGVLGGGRWLLLCC